VRLSSVKNPGLSFVQKNKKQNKKIKNPGLKTENPTFWAERKYAR